MEPEKVIDTAQPSGEPTAVVEAPETTSQPSYFDSEEAIGKRINELTAISRGNGSREDMDSAIKELDEIEKFLLDPERKKPVPAEEPAPTETAEVEQTTEEPAVESKKFHVHWKGQRVEYDDDNNLLGHKSTGELKAAHVKEKLRNQELEARLREAEEKLRSQPTPTPIATPAPVSRAPSAAPSTTPAVTPRQKPTPPDRPKLSTNDPTLYTEDDLKNIDDYESKRAKFDREIVEYMDYIAQRPTQVDPTLEQKLKALEQKQQSSDEVIQQTVAEKKALAEEKAEIAHWKRFSDFTDKHPVFKTEAPIRELNDKMVKWQDRVAEANGVSMPINGSADPGWDNYLAQRANVIERYFDGDAAVLKNAEGMPPPEEHDKYFKILELNNALSYYKSNGVLGEKATLEDAYLRQKLDTGELASDIETVRTAERVNAVTEFSNQIENIQQQAPGVDPATSAGGPDITQFGVPPEDMKWFMSIRGPQLQALQTKNPEAFKKWNAIADRVEQVALR